jgi:hypothetical protein
VYLRKSGMFVGNFGDDGMKRVFDGGHGVFL